MKKKKLLLAFMPMVMPTSPPLGIALLKGYLGRSLPEWDIELLDLNHWIHFRLMSGIASGQVALSAEMYAQMECDMPTLIGAANAFIGRDNENFYRNGSVYDVFAKSFLHFTHVFVKLMHKECETWQQTGELSPLLKEMCEEVDKHAPDVVGISMIFSEQIPLGALLGRQQRQQHGRKVFMGGSCFTEGVEHFLKWYPQSADAVITGDGEFPLKTLLQNGGRAALVPGVAYLRDDRVERCAPSFDKNIDQFGAPDFSGLPLKHYFSPKPVLPLLLSRGCYWRKCTFCVHYFSAGDSYRIHSLTHIIDMLRSSVAEGIRHFSFVDEMIAPGFFVQLSKAIQEAQLDIAYYALSKPNKTFSPTVLKDMAASGCKYILWGVESANQRVLDLMGKGTIKADIAKVLQDAHAAGIVNHIYVICGFPTETREEWQETLDFLHENKAFISAIHRGPFSLEQGSPISKDLPKFSITRTWTRSETPLGARLGYICDSGQSMEEAVESFSQALPFFRSFNPYARHLANYRDHALLVYDDR